MFCSFLSIRSYFGYGITLRHSLSSSGLPNILSQKNLSSSTANPKQNTNLVISQMMTASRIELDGSAEIKIPVPWGIIAGKVWGRDDGFPIIASHGWQENAGTFDTLAPLLPPSLKIISLDYPGCGYSSHYVDGMTYSFNDGLRVIHCVAKQLGLLDSGFALLGHSAGAGISLMYAGLFPEQVKSLCVIELVKPVSIPNEMYAGRVRRSLELYMKWDDAPNRPEPPIYTYEEAAKRMVEAVDTSLTIESAKVLMRRGARQVGPGERKDGKEGWVFTRDFRITFPSLSYLSWEQHLSVLGQIKAPMLIIKGRQAPMYEGRSRHEEILEFYRKNNPKFSYVEVEGTHHVHINHPERIASLIEQHFLGDDIPCASTSETSQTEPSKPNL